MKPGVREGLREARGPLGMAGGAMAVCCTIHLIILAGGVGAATGIAGGWLRNSYVIAAGVLTAAVAAALITRRVRRRDSRGDDTCCAPAAHHDDTTSASDAAPVPSAQHTVVGTGAHHDG